MPETPPCGWAIRPFRPADQAEARVLILDGLAEHFGWADPTANPDIDDIAASYLDRGHLFIVAEADSALIGSAGLVIEEGGSGRVVRVSVARACRRQGLARALVAHLLDAARARGLARVWVETNDDWGDALGLYLACGFHEYARAGGSAYLALDLVPSNPHNPPA
jgi:ribosomal protein S18 acetylase RimI-like enzyme